MAKKWATRRARIIRHGFQRGPRFPDVHDTFVLSAEEGNAFVILGRVTNGLRDAGADKATVDEFVAEAKSGDYDHLLSVVRNWIDVEFLD